MQIKLISIAVLLALVLGGLYWYGYSQREVGETNQKLEQFNKVIQQVEKREKIRREVRNLDDVALIREYCTCCVYGATKDECVRTYQPID